jgi:broad specificity phosphatase PhoE
MAVIYLVRHGQASFAADDYDALSPLGFEQARLLGEQLGRIHLKPDHVIAGAMRRHRETCATALAAMHLEGDGQEEIELDGRWATDARLNEYDHEDVITNHWPLFADREGRARWFVEQEKPKAAFKQIFDESIRHWQDDRYDYRENWQTFRDRVESGFRELCANANHHAHDNTLVFTSGGVISVILKYLLNMPDNSFQTFSMTLVNTGVTRIVSRQGKLQLAGLNEHLHLPKSHISYR